jgi:CheY-specific phosphatase CheX
MPMTTIEDEIRDITQTIWASLFQNTIEVDPTPTGAAPEVTSVVHIDGAWRGAVVVQCGMELATRLTQVLFQSDAPSFADVCDALGEVTNMLAGNLKAVLAEPSVLSLPAVARGSDYEVALPRTSEIVAVPMTCDGRPFAVRLFERTDAGGA